eukprot:1023940-Pelagomonas_calceolata.AAC.1
MRHVHLIGIKYCEDGRPGQQLETAQGPHADLCKSMSRRAVTPCTILLCNGRAETDQHLVMACTQDSMSDSCARFYKLRQAEPHSYIPGVGGTCYAEQTLEHFKKLGPPTYH